MFHMVLELKENELHLDIDGLSLEASKKVASYVLNDLAEKPAVQKKEKKQPGRPKKKADITSPGIEADGISDRALEEKIFGKGE